MSEYKPANIERLAEAMYQRECNYVGADHGKYCVAENIKTLKSFEDEIERLNAVVEAARPVAENVTSENWCELQRVLAALDQTRQGDGEKDDWSALDDTH